MCVGAAALKYPFDVVVCSELSKEGATVSVTGRNLRPRVDGTVGEADRGGQQGVLVGQRGSFCVDGVLWQWLSVSNLVFSSMFLFIWLLFGEEDVVVDILGVELNEPSMVEAENGENI